MPLIEKTIPSTSILDLPLDILELISHHLSLRDQLSFTATCKYLYNLRYRTAIPYQPFGLLTYAINWGLRQPPSPLGVYNENGFEPISALAPKSLIFHPNLDSENRWENFTEMASLARVKNIKIIDAPLQKNNYHGYLPSWLNTFANLTRLDIEYYHLEALPDELSELTKLQHLKIQAHYGLKNLPTCIGAFPALTHLDIHCDKLEILPDELSQLTKLQHLKIYAYHLKNLPSWVSTLSELTHLDIVSSQLETLPDELEQLTKLQHLYVFSETLTALPLGLGALSSLISLEVKCDMLKTLPDELVQLTKLQHVTIHSRSLTHLPVWLDSLPNLISLTLGYDYETNLIGSLISLKEVWKSVRPLPTGFLSYFTPLKKVIFRKD